MFGDVLVGDAEMPTESTSNVAPVGGRPMKWPLLVPRTVTRTATRSPVREQVVDGEPEIGKALAEEGVFRFRSVSGGRDAAEGFVVVEVVG